MESRTLYYLVMNQNKLLINTFNKEVAEYYRLLYSKKHKEDFKLLALPEGCVVETFATITPNLLVEKLIDDAEYTAKDIIYKSPEDLLRKVLEWEGLIGYTTSIICWVESYQVLKNDE